MSPINYFICNSCNVVFTDTAFDLHDELYALLDGTQICKTCFVRRFGGEDYELCLTENAGVVGGWE
ncbi:MAG TPA: hypothetical protein ENI27_03400 [bacterium]|nr:hypothetical protein [bacterium]